MVIFHHAKVNPFDTLKQWCRSIYLRKKYLNSTQKVRKYVFNIHESCVVGKFVYYPFALCCICQETGFEGRAESST